MSKTVLVTGVIGGVGSAVAASLIAEGCKVIGTVRSAEQEPEVRTILPDIAEVIAIDLSDAENVSPLLRPVLDRYQALHAVVVASGISPFGPLETTPLSELRNVFEINTISAVAIYQATIPFLRASKGHLILVSSVTGKVAFPFLGHYSASKFALEPVADTIRREAKDWGVKVVVIEPGGMKSRMTDLQHRQIKDRKAALSSEERDRYGYLYDWHEYGVSGKRGNYRPPEEAAAKIISALNLEDPDLRYPVNEAAERVCNFPKSMSDGEIDRIMATWVTDIGARAEDIRQNQDIA